MTGMRVATNDTGGADDVFVGALVTWLHVPRGGYGFTVHIPAKVVGYRRRPSTNVTIEVHGRGGLRRKTVSVDRLRWQS
jgi:hypothetical protein